MALELSLRLGSMTSFISYPKSKREYFHHTFKRKETRERGVHVVKGHLVRFRLFVVLSESREREERKTH